jgi:hypothetical protein
MLWLSLKYGFRVNISVNNGNVEMAVAPLESPYRVVSSTKGFRFFPHRCDITKGLNIIYGWVLISTKISRDSNHHLSTMPHRSWLMPMPMLMAMAMVISGQRGDDGQAMVRCGLLGSDGDVDANADADGKSDENGVTV